MTERKPFWQPKISVPQPAKIPEPTMPEAATAVFCEFVGESVAAGSLGRYCFNATFCPARCFSDPKVFAECTFRLEKLQENSH